MSDYLYGTWQDRKSACFSESSQKFQWYGARGITMFEPWIDDFKAFETWILINLGPRPNDLTLDRIDNDGHYEPGNLRWATMQEQADNRRAGMQPTNTGEHHISYVANPKRGKPHYVIKSSAGYKGCRRTLTEAINLRDSK